MSTIGHWVWNFCAVLGMWILAGLAVAFGYSMWKRLGLRRYEAKMDERARQYQAHRTGRWS